MLPTTSPTHPLLYSQRVVLPSTCLNYGSFHGRNQYMIVFPVGTVLIEFLDSSGAGLRIRQKSTVTQYVNHTSGETAPEDTTYESVRNVEPKNSINTFQPGQP
ncbi:hypothetical protein Zmor_024243 [Zophobas morio]|uniref:Uncharacterized protein n=1 Tax=Zophobas morio TaxID=2755281 RepID=A0AA38I0G6_9CUCU|nr:hypothetical protein Zmor_024243 [Zophobas morio]